jgi:hypothetical protein
VARAGFSKPEVSLLCIEDAVRRPVPERPALFQEKTYMLEQCKNYWQADFKKIKILRIRNLRMALFLPCPTYVDH